MGRVPALGYGVERCGLSRCAGVVLRLVDVYLTKPFPSMLCTKAKPKRKMLNPRGGKPLRAVPIRKLSPTSFGPKSPSMSIRETRYGVTARETKSAAAHQKAV